MNYQSLTLNPSYIAPSAWWQHVPIAHWLVSVLKPKKIVELGTHYGVSFFAFCEAAEHFSPDTFVYAVDTWEGDDHSGTYGDSVYNKVFNHWGKHHRARARLVRSTFDEASSHFEDASIDLLHIDGLHTYEAVKHDYETWLPKLKSDSIIIFHDINVREKDFGVWRFWHELSEFENCTKFEVLNGHGLGILIRGLQLSTQLKDVCQILPLLTAKGDLVERFAESSPGGSFSPSPLETEAQQARDEAQRARAETEQAKDEAQRARNEIQQARTEAQQAQDEAQRAKDEAQQAREEARRAKDEAQRAKTEARHAKDESQRANKFQTFKSTIWRISRPIRKLRCMME